MTLIKDRITQKEKEQIAYNHFLKKWTPAQAAGLAGNLAYESSMNERASGDNGVASGVAQWQTPRQKVFEKVYGKKFSDSTFEDQLNFVDWELENTHKAAGDMLRKTDHPIAAGHIVSDLYERPKVKYYENPDRQNAVGRVYREQADPNYQYPIQKQIQDAGDMVRDTMNAPQTAKTEDTEENNDDPKETPPKEVVEAKTELTQKQQEYNFLKDYIAGQQQPIQQQQEEPQQEYQSPDVTGEFNQISQFVDNPVMQQGGTLTQKKAWNPALKQDPNFQKWYKKNTIEGQNNIPYDENLSYDYLSFFMNGDNQNPDFNIEQHFPDTYKRPTHPTFSNESIYSTPENPGGYWEGEKYHKHGKFQLQQGGIIDSSRGQWDNPGQVTRIPSGNITTMPDPITGRPLNMNLLGISNLGEIKVMTPNNNYKFKGTSVTEYPIK